MFTIELSPHEEAIRISSFLNRTKDEIYFSEKHVFIHDLSATYCNFFYNKNDCSKYKRNNLVLNEDLFNNYNYDIMIPLYKNSFSNVDHYKKYNIMNTKSLLDSLIENKVSVK